MFNKLLCRIIIYLLPKRIISKKIRIILKKDKLKIIIPNKGNSPEDFENSVKGLIDYFS